VHPFIEDIVLRRRDEVSFHREEKRESSFQIGATAVRIHLRPEKALTAERVRRISRNLATMRDSVALSRRYHRQTSLH